MHFQTRRVISAAHPTLAGHFPGAPIVPGVVLLEEIAGALAEWRAGARVKCIRAVKFLQPMTPEQPFAISLAAAGENEIVFSCRTDDGTAVEGRCEIAVGAR